MPNVDEIAVKKEMLHCCKVVTVAIRSEQAAKN